MLLFPKSIGIFLIRMGCFYLALLSIVTIFQRRLIYHPTHSAPDNPPNKTGYRPWLAEGRVIGYCREVSQPENVWLMLHGNAGQAAHRDYALSAVSPRDSFYVLEYPGYGIRSGSPNKDSMNAAAAEAYDRLQALYPGRDISVLGESLGSGPASFLAGRSKPPVRIVLVVPFDTLAGLAAGVMPLFPARLLLFDRWDNIRSLTGYRGKLDIFGAKEDRIIPIRHARNLARSIPTSEFHEISGGHNDWPLTVTFNRNN